LYLSSSPAGKAFPDSHTFKPERFLENNSPLRIYAFWWWSARCIGEVLAIDEMKIAIATILANYQLTLVSRTPEKPSRRGVTLAPSPRSSDGLKRTTGTSGDRPDARRNFLKKLTNYCTIRVVVSPIITMLFCQ
jgi:hypothetical protein